FYFVFDRPQPRRTLVVSGDPQAIAALQLAAAISPDPAIPCSAEIITPEQLKSADWEGLALLVWHAPLPEGDAAQAAQTFVQRGGQVVFLPPRTPGDAAFLGARWQSWTEERAEMSIET